MPNKAIRHTKLDQAIVASLSESKVKAKLDWKEVESILLKKIEPAPSPLDKYSYSLNSIVTVISVNTSDYFKSIVFFAKRWVTAIYLITGGIIITTGTYFIYDFSRVTVHEKEIINKPASVPVQTNEPDKAATASSTTEKAASSIVSIGKEEVKPGLNEGSRPVVYEGNKPVINKTAEPEVNAGVKPEAPDFSTENTREAFDGTKEVPAQSKESSGQKESSALEEDKKAKVLYYKENLSLDKLEQQLTRDKMDSLK